MGITQILIICFMMSVFIKPEDLPVVLQGIKKMIRMYRQFMRSGQELLDQISLDDASVASNKPLLSTSSSQRPSTDNTEQHLASASSNHRVQNQPSPPHDAHDNAGCIEKESTQ